MNNPPNDFEPWMFILLGFVIGTLVGLLLADWADSKS